MGTRFLIDTCAVIKYLQESFPEEALLFLDSVLNNESQISFITKIELLAWKTQSEENINILKQFINGSKIIYINDIIINKAIEIRRHSSVKLPDAIIAATAISNDFILISDNDKDFRILTKLGLSYLNPKE
jgi:predicted nucleic acid-binding protein